MYGHLSGNLCTTYRELSSTDQEQTQPDKQISQIEKSVTHLLVATKQLLETLTSWSRNQAQEEEVSDVYVRLGYEFNLACRAFNSIGVDTSDLGPVPDLLRAILEDTLSQPASPQALDNYLPRIRDIIINLLHGLKRKQSKLRGRSVREAGGSSRGALERQTSGASLVSTETGLTSMLENVPSQYPVTRSESRQDSLRSGEDRSFATAPEVTSSVAGDRNSTSLKRHSVRRDLNRPMAQSESTSSMSSATAQAIPVLQPYADVSGVASSPSNPPSSYPDGERSRFSGEASFPHPPPPPPKQDDALMALQRGGDLERRASRRFSAFQISKHLGANGVPVIPPAQNSPIPNRGREVRESMNAVRSRTSYQHGRQRSNNRVVDSSSPSRTPVRAPQRISEEREGESPALQTTPKLVPNIEIPAAQPLDDSPTAKTPEEFHRRSIPDVTSPTVPDLRPTSGPLSPGPEFTEDEIKPAPPQHQQISQTVAEDDASTPATVERRTRAHVTPPQSQLIESDSSPPQGKDLTLFLQYKSKVKKFVLSEGYTELSMARLQLAFIEKFAWNTHNNGVDLPEIYIQDPVSGVRHELEDLSDVKDRCVLVLNVEVLDEVKKHFDDGIAGLRTPLESIRSLVDSQNLLIHRVADRQLDTSKEMARMSTVPNRASTKLASIDRTASASTPSSGSLEEVQRLKRDIAVLRQTYATMSSDFAVAMDDIKTKAANVKSVAADAAVPSYVGNAGRLHIGSGKKTLTHDSETLVSHVDDLQDRVEDLRKDVVTRGVRPLPRALEDMNRDITTAVKDLAKMKDFIKREKPVWTKIWESELALVCTERDDLTSHEELIGDLTSDLEELTGIFKLVEETTKQQNLQNGPGGANSVGGVNMGGVRSTSRTLPIDPDIDPQKAKDGVLGEVRALQPNHENRLEAIERAEKARLKELESREGSVFQREVEKFVEEGKLKKTGGADEVERMRKVKDEKARRENYERMQARQAEMEARAAAAAAEAANPAQPPAMNGPEDGGIPNREDVDTQEQHHRPSLEYPEHLREPEPHFQDAHERHTNATSDVDPVMAYIKSLPPADAPIRESYAEGSMDGYSLRTVDEDGNPVDHSRNVSQEVAHEGPPTLPEFPTAPTATTKAGHHASGDVDQNPTGTSYTS